MSFYTALTGLNGAQADISATSNNIANVGTTGFKRSRAEFGDIFATSPLQNASSSIGSGTILKGIKQQFTQGNIASSLNALDMAISGQGFFALKPSLTSSQTVYTRNGSFNVDNDRYVVDSAGQYLMTYPVNQDGSVTAKDLDSAVPLQLPVTSGEPKATSLIDLGVNVPADAPVITNQEQFADGYTFNPDDPTSYTNSTSITIFDDLGNPTIATIYFIKTQNASAEDPTNKYDTRLVINNTIIDPNLVSAVDDSGKQIFVDRFGAQTTTVPDDNYFLEGKGSPLYKLDDLNQELSSQPASLTGDSSGFDFGEEGDKRVNIVTDPLLFASTVEGGNSGSDTYWGNDFLLVNVDNGDQAVSIDVRPGSYNAEELAAEVERAINEAYGDDSKFQIVQNVDDELTIDLFRLNADGSSVGLGNKITVDLLAPTYVSDLVGAENDVADYTAGASPDFTKSEFLAHTQLRINDTLNNYVISGGADAATALGVDGRLFVRGEGDQMSEPHTATEIISFTHHQDADASGTGEAHYLAYSYFGKTPNLSVYDSKTDLGANASDTEIGDSIISYDSTQNIMEIYLDGSVLNAADLSSMTVQLNGTGSDTFETLLNGRDLRLLDAETIETSTGSGIYRTVLKVDTSALGFPDADFNMTGTGNSISLLSSPADDVEAYFETTQNANPSGQEQFYSNRIVLRETGSAATRTTADTTNGTAISIDAGNSATALAALGLDNFATELNWVDEKNPPIKVDYDEINQRLQFTVDRTVLGTGTGSEFNSFTVYGAADADSTNGLGIPASGNADEVLIRGGEILSTESFIASGEEIQLNDKRYGIKVAYNSDTKSFSIASGTTGETIPANGALGVDEGQRASNIQVGRHLINQSTGKPDSATVANLESRIFGDGNNYLMGFGASITDFTFQEGVGLASKPAIATGRAAQGDLTEIFRLSSTNNENRFNISVNGVSGVIDVPPGNYVGTTLAAALQERVNQISDPITGETVGGVTVKYVAADNNFVFTTGTTGDGSTIKVKGTARLGLDDVPLGVGSVPKIKNMVQATNEEGLALYVDASGNVTTTPPENMVDGYYPLYIDEGELTFDKTGKLLSPSNNVRYEQQAEGFSISLDIDYSASTQFAQPFSVLAVEQDGYTSGRLDGLEIDSSGTIRANYTNGQNNPLGKIVVANFNNQNGLKQIGNATYVETAVSGTPQVGEAGAEGFGNILSGSLERSNVDITEELVNLITAQRNYQASAKAIETTTSLTQTIINIRP